MTLKRRILAAAAAIVVLTALGLATPSPASAAAVPSASSSSSGVAQPDGKPTGCPSGFFCGWEGTNGNGGNCIDLPYYTNASSWVTSACWGHVATIFNNSYVCSGCDTIRLYYLPNYAGAYADLGRGDYYLDLSKNKFGGVGLQGNGTAMKDNIRSSKWS